MSVLYPAVTVTGGILTGGLIQRLGEGENSLPLSGPESYGLTASESVRRLANRNYLYLREKWLEFAKVRARKGDTVTVKETRDKWLLILLRELGFAELTALTGGIVVDERLFPVSHRWHAVPVHLLGWGMDLDHRSPGDRGGQAPHSMVQQLLNRSSEHLWAVLSNGRKLRLLRDSTSLSGVAYIEFDLEAIFDGELFPDFVLMFRLAHASRFAVRDEETGPASCVLEKWRSVGAQEGERALEQLRRGVEQAIEILGTGFLDHPANTALRARMRDGLSEADFQRSLLRLVYRLLFWFVTEDRDLLLVPPPPPEAPAPERHAHEQARQRYREYFSSRRLRDLAVARRHGRHGDLWHQVQVVFNALGDPEGRGLPLIAVPAIGGLFTTKRPAEPERGEPPGTWVTLPLDAPLDGVQLTNTDLLRAVEALAVLPATAAGRRRPVDFVHLGAEELGGVYEGLLEVQPRWDPSARAYHLERLAGNERKTTGSYYTPASLVECLLDSALDPLIQEACAKPTREERIDALLNLTVCDPACGSGHFLIAAARRIAKAYAAEETGEAEPTPDAVRHATRLVIGRCIYGVDVNEMAAELAKVSLWLEAMEPGKPLGFLDANIRVGNSLLGTTPALLAAGIPDEAYVALAGDDKKVVAALRKQNAEERDGAENLFGGQTLLVGNREFATAAAAIVRTDVGSLSDVHVQEQRARELEASRRSAQLVADAWCAAFVQPRTEDTRNLAITHDVLRDLAGPDLMGWANIIDGVSDIAGRYRFFHWHLEFPHIFRVPDNGLGTSPAGWDGGFSLVIGNPPWERVKLQEKEFFASRREDIANAANAAKRKAAILALATSDEPADRALYAEWMSAQRVSEGVSHLVRDSGRFPLTATGDINTYAVFAETARTIVSPDGQVGLVVPTGIATDATTQRYFRDLVVTKTLVSLYDFENEDKVFTNVHNQYRFALLTLSGVTRRNDRVSLVFRVRQTSQIGGRAFTLTPDEIAMLNPNTGTCPVFFSRRDAEIVLRIYRRVPILWHDDDHADGNPWVLSFLRMFDMANDSDIFRTAEDLEADGWRLDGNVYVRDGVRMLPLYEGKMVHHFDHRFATYEGATQEQLNKGTLPRLDDHDDPMRVPMPRYWVSEGLDPAADADWHETLFGPEPARDKTPSVDLRLGAWKRGWLLGWRDTSNSANERTVIAAVIPRAAAGHKFLLVLGDKVGASLQANLSAFVLDYVARQKLSGASLAYFVVKQLPVLPPKTYTGRPLWADVGTLDEWITARVLELTYTAHDIEAYARDLGDQGAPFRWIPERRDVMRAELDAAYFHLYGIERDDVDYIMDTFKVVRYKDERAHGEYRTKRLILERYDAMATAIRTGRPYETPLDPPPGHGPRHPARTER